VRAHLYALPQGLSTRNSARAHTTTYEQTTQRYIEGDTDAKRTLVLCGCNICVKCCRERRRCSHWATRALRSEKCGVFQANYPPGAGTRPGFYTPTNREKWSEESLSDVWTTSTCYQYREIEQGLYDVSIGSLYSCYLFISHFFKF